MTSVAVLSQDEESIITEMRMQGSIGRRGETRSAQRNEDEPEEVPSEDNIADKVDGRAASYYRTGDSRQVPRKTFSRVDSRTENRKLEGRGEGRMVDIEEAT